MRTPIRQLLTFLLFLNAVPMGLAAQDATVLEVERIVSIQKPGGKALPAKKDDVLGLPDILRTGSKSRALLKLNDSVQLRVEQLTDLQLLGLSNPQAQAGRSEISIKRGVF